MDDLLIMAALFGGGAFMMLRMMKSKPFHGSTAFDLRRSIVIVGPSHNDEECVLQRKALKPLLRTLDGANISIIEAYGDLVPRKNGEAMALFTNDALRRMLDAEAGFHLICLDDDAEPVLQCRRAIPYAALADMISEEAIREEAPTLDFTNMAPPALAGHQAPTPWSVGVLR